MEEVSGFSKYLAEGYINTFYSLDRGGCGFDRLESLPYGDIEPVNPGWRFGKLFARPDARNERRTLILAILLPKSSVECIQRTSDPSTLISRAPIAASTTGTPSYPYDVSTESQLQ